MEALKGLYKASPKVIEGLRSKFGVRCKVYKPLHFNTYGQSKDDDIEYDPDPIYEGLLLIPAVAKQRSQNSSVAIDPFIDDEIKLFCEPHTKFPIGALIDVATIFGSLRYRIHLPQVIADDEHEFLVKYILVPVASMVPVTNEETLAKFSDLELELEPLQEPIDNSDWVGPRNEDEEESGDPEEDNPQNNPEYVYMPFGIGGQK